MFPLNQEGEADGHPAAVVVVNREAVFGVFVNRAAKTHAALGGRAGGDATQQLVLNGGAHVVTVGAVVAVQVAERPAGIVRVVRRTL